MVFRSSGFGEKIDTLARSQSRFTVVDAGGGKIALHNALHNRSLAVLLLWVLYMLKKNTSKFTIPETNSEFTPENGWLELEY